jgi:hypothetical protein
VNAEALDRWLPAAAVRTHHCREAPCDAPTLWRAAEAVTVGDSGKLGWLIRWRVPGSASRQTYREMFTSAPFVLLDEGPQRLLAGLCGKIWAARPVLASLDGANEFLDWRVPGTVRVLFAQWATPSAAGATLVSEVRVAPVDRAARLAVRGMSPLIGRFEGLIGSEPLRVAVQRAQAAPPAAVRA